ncbi:hypothetical protein J5U18_07185 [Sphingobacteriaceae bacterium WQ 2009]|uniref:Uncharacterized protein n=1 Tax=Rhinopithecimicrobium faecis TaxID=2820698 RepID=A0A8T4HD96_9SPHI|nr:hypothetical protein [Sphingobacteriaceae bacterium WQ 2009]
MKNHIFTFLILLFPSFIFAQQTTIQNFTLKESITNPLKIAIIATDKLDVPQEGIQGTYTFSFNGFKQELKFNGGVATITEPIENSTFAFLKHKNAEGTNVKLFYIYKSDNGLSPLKISGLALLIIPGIILLVAYIFKRVIITAIVLALGMGFFNVNHGLSISSILETIFNSLKGMFF